MCCSLVEHEEMLTQNSKQSVISGESRGERPPVWVGPMGLWHPFWGGPHDNQPKSYCKSCYRDQSPNQGVVQEKEGIEQLSKKRSTQSLTISEAMSQPNPK